MSKNNNTSCGCHSGPTLGQAALMTGAGILGACGTAYAVASGSKPAAAAATVGGLVSTGALIFGRGNLRKFALATVIGQAGFGLGVATLAAVGARRLSAWVRDPPKSENPRMGYDLPAPGPSELSAGAEVVAAHEPADYR